MRCSDSLLARKIHVSAIHQLFLDDEGIGVTDWPEYHWDMKRHASTQAVWDLTDTLMQLWEEIICRDLDEEHGQTVKQVYKTCEDHTHFKESDQPNILINTCPLLFRSLMTPACWM